MADFVFVDALAGIYYRYVNLLLVFDIIRDDSDALAARCVLFGIVQKDNEDLLNSVRITINSREHTVVILNGEFDACFFHDGLESDLNVGDKSVDVEGEHLKCKGPRLELGEL